MPQEQEKVKPENGLSFETAMAGLEKIVAEMEQGGVPLDKLLQKTAEAQKLAAYCQKQLDTLEKNVKILLKDSPQGQTWGDFETPDAPKE